MPYKLNKLNNNIIQSAINDEAKKHSAKSVSNTYGLLSAVLKSFHPSLQLNITLPQKEKKDIITLDNEKLTDLIIAFLDTEIEVPVLLSLWLGLRKSEICGLKWDCVNEKESTITIKKAMIVDKNNKYVLKKTTKTVSSARKLKVPIFIMDKIKQVPKIGEFVININNNVLYKKFKRILNKNKLPPEIRFHDLRHFNASVMLLLNIPDKYAMERNGWATNYTMKNVYQHTFSDERITVDNNVDNYFLSLLSHRLSHKN